MVTQKKGLVLLASLLLLVNMIACSGKGGRGSSAQTEPDNPTEIQVAYTKTGNPTIEVTWVGDPHEGSYTVAIDTSAPYDGDPALVQEKAFSPAKFVSVDTVTTGDYMIYVIPVSVDGTMGEAVAYKDSLHLGSSSDDKGTDPKGKDSDGDGVPDDVEVQCGTDPEDPDSKPINNNKDGDYTDDCDDADGDGVTNGDEKQCGTDPFDPSSTPVDNNGDGDYTDPGDDIDDDGTINSGETDTDGDGVSDDVEESLGSDPNNSDVTPADNNHDSDYTDPEDDTDGDGVSNADEEDCGTDPDDYNSTPVDNNKDGDFTDPGDDIDDDGTINSGETDTDGDGVSDDVEEALGSDPNNGDVTPEDADGDGNYTGDDDDADGDGVSNDDEEFCGTDPDDYDSTPVDNNTDGDFTDPEDDIDGDGTINSGETDTDGDGVSDDVEESLGSDPNNGNVTPEDADGDGNYTGDDDDADGDGVSNDDEVQCGTDPNNSNSKPVDNNNDGDYTDDGDDIDGDGITNESDSEDDSDGDGVVDMIEIILGSDPTDPDVAPKDNNNDGDYTDPEDDADGDGVINSIDTDKGENKPADNNHDGDYTDPGDDIDGDGISNENDIDYDKDGVSDAVEIILGSDPTDSVVTPKDNNNDGDYTDPEDDADGDGITNGDEEKYGSDPFDNDSKPADKNGDGDYTDPEDDLDGDGTINSEETDTDHDGICDDVENYLGSDPYEGTSKPNDSNSDGDYTGPEDDADGDGVSNADEEKYGSDPNDGTVTPVDSDENGDYTGPNDDMDGDGILNKDEHDGDGDGICDDVEEILGSDPDNGTITPVDQNGDGDYTDPEDDADGDGASNEIEESKNTDPNDNNSKPLGADIPTDITAVSNVSGQIEITWTGNANHGSYIIEVSDSPSCSGTVYKQENAGSSPVTMTGFNSGDFWVFVTPVGYDGTPGDPVAAGDPVVVENPSLDVQNACAALGVEDIGFGGSDSAQSVTQNFILPLIGEYSTSISWSVSEDDESYVLVSGSIATVKRPAHGEGDKTVQLIATVSQDGFSAQKYISVTIKEMPLEVISELIKPGSGMIQVDQAITVEVPFGCELDGNSISTITAYIADAAGNVVDAVVSYDSTDNGLVKGTVIIDPISLLAELTSYTVTISTEVEKEDGTNLLEPVIFSFTTIEAEAIDYIYSFDDLIGSGNSQFTVTGDVSLDDSNCHQGNASVSFGGSADCISLGNVDLGGPDSEDYSVAIWVYLKNPGYAPEYADEQGENPKAQYINTILSNAPSFEKSNGFKLFVNSWGTQDHRIIFEAGNGTVGGKLRTEKNFVVFDGWYHFVITVDKTNHKIKLYFNGDSQELEFVSEDGHTITDIPWDFKTSGELLVGQFTGAYGPGDVWNLHNYYGNMDDLRIYNRVLTPGEVARIAQEN